MLPRPAHAPISDNAEGYGLAVKVVPRAGSVALVHVPLQAPLQPVASANTGLSEGSDTGQQAPFVLRYVLRWQPIPADHQPRERGSGQFEVVEKVDNRSLPLVPFASPELLAPAFSVARPMHPPDGGKATQPPYR